MRKCLFTVAVAALVVGSPAAARDQSGYFGVEGGVLLPPTTHVDGRISDGSTTIVGNDLFGIKYKKGYDLDLIGGYDFGMVRLEGELGYKRAGVDRLSLSGPTLRAISDALGAPVSSDDLRTGGHARVLSGMANGLFDFGGPGLGAYAGGGLGLADVKLGGTGGSASKSKFAWQLLAGIRTPVSDHVDLGLKYRYFQTGKLRFSDQIAAGDDVYTASLAGRFSSHSLLASLAYNFGSRATAASVPAVSYAPPPLPAVTDLQTCPDGSTVPLTSACPFSYAPPPPPPPSPAYRGERG